MSDIKQNTSYQPGNTTVYQNESIVVYTSTEGLPNTTYLPRNTAVFHTESQINNKQASTNYYTQTISQRDRTDNGISNECLGMQGWPLGWLWSWKCDEKNQPRNNNVSKESNIEATTPYNIATTLTLSTTQNVKANVATETSLTTTKRILHNQNTTLPHLTNMTKVYKGSGTIGPDQNTTLSFHPTENYKAKNTVESDSKLEMLRWPTTARSTQFPITKSARENEKTERIPRIPMPLRRPKEPPKSTPPLDHTLTLHVQTKSTTEGTKLPKSTNTQHPVESKPTTCKKVNVSQYQVKPEDQHPSSKGRNSNKRKPPKAKGKRPNRGRLHERGKNKTSTVIRRPEKHRLSRRRIPKKDRPTANRQLSSTNRGELVQPKGDRFHTPAALSRLTTQSTLTHSTPTMEKQPDVPTQINEQSALVRRLTESFSTHTKDTSTILQTAPSTPTFPMTWIKRINEKLLKFNTSIHLDRIVSGVHVWRIFSTDKKVPANSKCVATAL
ncbi:uncharacterized protein LOC118406461 [Branchiostoma floridae]|uniref:Uncharacterized protein LOC118406461 n=1 Tax=Branchiostoma floridae TaxID=7739 RepID=A0A9J7K9Q5_BRAFL|nr:uncharacterized protein LOC118406461 [Branchiostoma floridae]